MSVTISPLRMRTRSTLLLLTRRLSDYKISSGDAAELDDVFYGHTGNIRVR
jgi:hypothetical protein